MANNDPVELTRAGNQLRSILTVIIDELYQRGQPQLAIPFAEMLVTLSSADHAAIRELDAVRESGLRDGYKN